MIAVRKLSPGGYEYLTGSVACADRGLEPGESLSDYYLANGYPPGQWFGRGAAVLGLSGEVTAAQMNALFGEGRHPDADRIEAEMIAAGHSPSEAMAATKLGNRFPRFDGIDEIRSEVIAAYTRHNRDHGRPANAPIDAVVRARIRREVQVRSYARAHRGALPTDDELAEWLAEQSRAKKSAVSGYELVIAPPKSVSVLWALADDATRALVAEMHREAMRDTLTYFEDVVAYTRKGAGGIAQYDVQGITAACFEHWDSRAGDPHLHTHVAISCKVQGPDGTWTSLDGRTILAAAVTMSEYYNSRIRDKFRDAGAGWEQRPIGGIDVKRPVWELAGLPIELLAGFSKRAGQVEQDRARRIVAFRRANNREPRPKELLELSRQAQYATRSAKQPPRSLGEHLREWRQQAAAMVSPQLIDDLAQRVFGAAEPTALVDQATIAAAAEATLRVVSDNYAHFNTWNLEAEAHRQTAHLRVAPGTRDSLIATVVQAAVADSDTVMLEAPSVVEEPAALRRRSGESVFTTHNSQRYTTRRTLHAEAAIAAWGRLTDGHRVSRDVVRRTLTGAHRLNDGQRHAVAAFATSGRRVQLLYAPAGAGKTATMKVYADAVRASRGRVFAFGPSARAAQELAQSIDARPHTLHQVTTALRLGVAREAFPFARGDVLIVDEAAMAGTHTLHAVLSYAMWCGANVRLVGDDKQLPAVEAGGAVRWFAHNNGVVRLREVVRFADKAQAAASLMIRMGRAKGLDYYFEHHWVKHGSRETCRDDAHRAWRRDLETGRQSLLIVPQNEEVVALNREARAIRLQRGEVDSNPAATVELHDGTSASRGDLVVTRRNNRHLILFGGKDFVKNGDTWQIIAVRDDGALQLRHLANRGIVVLPADYVEVEVELAYATTIHRVQGMTSTGSAHGVVTQGMSLEQLYPMLTRARHDNRVYVETHKHTIDSHQETPNPLKARDVLAFVLQRSSAETSATEELRAALANAGSLRTLVTRHDYVALDGVEERIDAELTELAPTALDRRATPALRQTLLTAESLGWQSSRLIAEAHRAGPIDDPDVQDPAALLGWRIKRRVEQDEPPARLATPTEEAIRSWRDILSAPTADLTTSVWDPVWDTVWQLAAAAEDDGLDTAAAFRVAIHRLTDRPTNDPTPAHRLIADALTDDFDRQRAAGAGWQPALPWLAHHSSTKPASDPELQTYLDRINEAIASRARQLRDIVAAEQPQWTAVLGPRPADEDAACEWDEIAGLWAAYRDTYGITTMDPRTPLGDMPDGDGRKARAWKALTAKSRPAEKPPASGEPRRDGIHAAADPDAVMAALAASEIRTPDPADVTLAELAARYNHAVRVANQSHLDDQITQVLTQRAPTALGAGAEPALRSILRRAHEDGWMVEHAVPDVDSLGGLVHANDSAAVLYRIVERRILRAAPPTSRTNHEQGPLPWLTAPNPDALAARPDLAVHIDDLGSTITERVTALRAGVVARPPAWVSGLGPRPSTPVDAARWDVLAGLAAAYRDTYRVTTVSPDAPLGIRPANGAVARVWAQLNEQWTPIALASEQMAAANQARIDTLTAGMLNLGNGDGADNLAEHLDDDLHNGNDEDVAFEVDSDIDASVTEARSEKLADAAEIDPNLRSRLGL